MSDIKFAQHSIIDILVPESSGIDIEDALQNAAEIPREDDTNLLSSIAQRNLLYFDEELPLYVVLRTLYQDAVALKNHVSRLAVVIEAHAISSPGASGHANESNPATTGGHSRDVVWSSRLDVAEDPVLVVEGSDEDDAQDALLIWKLNAFLSRPRVRLQAPAIIFKISASLQPAPTGKVKAVEEYLPSGVALPMNILGSMGADPKLAGMEFYLPASRLAKSTAVDQPARAEVLPLKVVSRRAFRAIPAISSRMRYHRSNDAVDKSAILASLELDIPIFAPYAVEITKVIVKFSTGEIQGMIRGQTIELPTICRARDNIACLYALTQPSALPSAVGQPSTMRSLDIMVDANVLVSEGCRPSIRIRWKQNIDFATALNQKFNRVRGSIHRDNRPRSLSTNTNASAPAGDTQRPGPNEEMGLTVTITGKEGIYVGEAFTWDVFVVNKSNKTRQFGVVVIPKRRSGDGKRLSSRPTSTQSLPGLKGGSLAEAVIDDNVLYAIIKTQGHESVPLIPLTTDARTSQLSPGACFNVRLELLPMSKGFVQVEAVRIVDLESNETVDIRDLPDIMVSERQGS